MKTTVVIIALCGFVLADGISRDKIQHKYRPVKESDSALLEKPVDSVTSSEVEDDEDIDLSQEYGTSDFDITDLFPKEGLEETKDLFSGIWSELFGSRRSGETGILPDENDSDLESPEERSFFNGILDLMRPWWRGDNVCKREEESEEEEEESRSPTDFFSSLLTSCKNYGDAYKCTMKVGRGGKTVIKTLIYECCHGWTRQAGGRGCTQRFELKDMTDTLREKNLTGFIDTLNSVGMTDRLSEGNFTVFVPTNKALSAVSNSEEVSFVLLDSEDKMEFVREIIQGHILPGWHYSHEWTDEMTLQTEKEGSSVRVNFYDYPAPFTTINCARLLSTNTQTLDGLIHTVDRVMMPARQNIWEILGQDPRFSVFSSIVSDNLQEKFLDSNQHLTVLAFTDEQFENFPTDVQQSIRNKEGCFADFAEHLTIPHTICSAAIQSDAVVRNLAGKLVNATIDNEENVKFHGVPIQAADRMATNGVIHIMNGVILLEHMMDAVDLARNKLGDQFTALLEQSGLNENLPDTVTLFVPTNDVVLESGISETTQEELRNTLKNHILNKELMFSRSSPDDSVETEAGRNLEVSVKARRSLFFQSPPLVTVGCARVVRANLKSCDGVVHFVDRVLKVPSKSSMEVLRENAQLSEFVSLLEIAGLDTLLNSSDFTGTVLAPSNEAIDSYLKPEDKEKLLGDSDKLKAVLNQHILKVQVCCHGFASSSIFEQNGYETLAENYLVSSHVGSRKRIGGAFVTNCDNEATNGIVHIVDRPIIRRRATSILDLFSRGGSRDDFNWNVDWPF